MMALDKTLYDHLLDLPDGVTGEILNGQLYAHPRPHGRHILAATGIRNGHEITSRFFIKQEGFRCIPPGVVAKSRRRPTMPSILRLARRAPRNRLLVSKRREVIPCPFLSGQFFGPYHAGRGGPGGWWILAEPEIHFEIDREVSVPDVAGWRRERMPAIPDSHKFDVVPDWICEILSPSTESIDREIKTGRARRDSL